MERLSLKTLQKNALRPTRFTNKLNALIIIRD